MEVTGTDETPPRAMLLARNGLRYALEATRVTVRAGERVDFHYGDIIVFCLTTRPLNLPLKFLVLEHYSYNLRNADNTVNVPVAGTGLPIDSVDPTMAMRTTDVNFNSAFNVMKGSSMLYNPWEEDITVQVSALHLDQVTRSELHVEPVVMSAIPYLEA